MATIQDIHWKRVSVEAVAIVASILLAFSIDAWWGERQEFHETEKMVAALQVDFAQSREKLALSIKEVEERIADTETLMTRYDSEQVPVSDLRRYFRNALIPMLFRPSLSSYDSAVATGQINTLESRALTRAFSDFLFAYQTYSEVRELHGEIYFVGPVWDLRQSIGSLRVLYRDPVDLPARLQLSEAEYRELMSRTDVYALIENMMDIHRNSLSTLGDMEAAASAILIELETLQ
jgi:hypothetical protein